MERREIVGIIPARAGSKGLPQKNILKVGNNSLIDISIGHARTVCDEIVVTTDFDQEEIGTNDGYHYHRRASNLCTDDARMTDVIANVINECGLADKIILLLQPTSPIRSREILQSLRKNDLNDDELVLSVVETEFNTFKSGFISDGRLEAHRKNSDFFMNRQALEKTFKPNGSIYLFSANSFLKFGGFGFPVLKPLIMSKLESIDIDSLEDLKYCEKILGTET